MSENSSRKNSVPFPNSSSNSINNYLTIDNSIAGIQQDFNPFSDSNSYLLDTRSIASPDIQLHTIDSSGKEFLMDSDDDENNDLIHNSSTGNLLSTNQTPLLGTTGTFYHHSRHASNVYPVEYNQGSTPLAKFINRVVCFFKLGKNNGNGLILPITEEPLARTTRDVYPEMPHNDQFPINAICNSKYNAFSFLPIILYEQFKFFFNLYFLLVALSQAIPALRIGYLSSYVVPLAFVLFITMSKEAIDDIQRRRRDSEQNNELYECLNNGLARNIPSKSIKVGDLIRLHKGKRIPADMILLQSSEEKGESFIKTDQLDGETDWKLRIAVPISQSLSIENLQDVMVTADSPNKSIHHFYGNLTYNSTTLPLNVDNTLWCNTVLASGSAIGIVVYTGSETRQSMNQSRPGVKVGLLELEINKLSKLLCLFVFVLSIILVIGKGFNSTWYVDITKYLILFSTIIPVSLRVNLDLGKSVYAYQIEHDSSIPETIVRTSTIPEDLGRIEYLLSDKTGTLTQNDMEMKKLHLGTVSYAGDSMDLVVEFIRANLIEPKSFSNGGNSINKSKIMESKSRRDMGQRIYDLIVTLALCHNVTPSMEDGELAYQAASPDEIAIVKYTESVGISLVKRDRTSITLMQNCNHMQLHFGILHVFPFNSDTKRMGLVVCDKLKNEYWFLLKGADTVMKPIVTLSVWLDEEVSNMAREGLRTLVIARKKLTKSVYEKFNKQYKEASLMVSNDRDTLMQQVVHQFLENEMELLGLTGVEDKLQKDVKSSIELLRNAGVKIWMLTGDKVETAKCVAISCKLISRGQYVHTITKISKNNHQALAMNSIEFLMNKANRNSCLVIDGESLGVYLKYYRTEFFNIVIDLPAVIACRCTPQQKADVALLIRELTKKRVCCIGDGGNDVNMIQSADVGVGIVGKEGKQASLAADFSVTQFCHITKLLLWHGRNSYKRSAKLSQFVIHRGLVISICQMVYSISSKFEPLALYQGWLMVGYATCYTMAPVFSLVLDTDVNENLAYLYPELYKELTRGKSLSYLSFLMWFAISTYQGIVIQLFSQFFTSISSKDFLKMVAISFSTLVMNELIMVGVCINTWNKVMLITLLVTLIIYWGSVPFLPEYFDLGYVLSVTFLWELCIIIAVSILPIWATKSIYRRLNPPNYAKVQS